jgi:hypothetical protein
MSDPRGEYGFLDFFTRNGHERLLQLDDAEHASGSSAVDAVLVSYTIPKGTLTDPGQRLKIKVRGSFAGNSNSKRLRAVLGVGPLSIFDSVASTSWNGHTFVAEGIVVALTHATEKAAGRLLGATGAGAAAVLGTGQENTAGTEDLTTDLTLSLKVTGTTAGDVKVEGVEISVVGLVPGTLS